MSMKKKSVSALILVFMLVFVVIGTQVCAIEITPRWKIISQCVTTLKVSGNTGTINFSVVLNRVDYGIDANVCLQQMKNNKWTEIDSWDVSDEGLCRLSATKFLSSGYDYRIKSIITVTDTNGKQVEKITKYSDTEHVS